MKGLADKLRLIYKPFVFIAIGFILTYTLLHWLLFIKAGIPLKEDILKVLLPLGLPWIPILIWLRPRIKLLNFKNEKATVGFLFLASFAIAIPTTIAQEYLATATGKLTPLDNISQIEKSEKTKYYSLKNCYIDKKHIAIQSTTSISGKHNSNFNMNIYIVMPILINNADTIKFRQKYWLEKKYYKRINNRLSAKEKDEKYKIFVESSHKEFEETDFRKFTFLEVIGNTKDHDEYNNALMRIGQNLFVENIIFKAHTEPFEARNGKKLPWAFGSLGIGLLTFFIFLVFPKFQEDKLKNFKNGEIEEDTELKEFLNYFIPREGFFITPIIINLNLLVYMIMVFSGLDLASFKASDLLNWGVSYRPLTTDGQWWRLLTNTFIHSGLIHILINMYGLLFIGIFLEPHLGKKKFAFVYLLTGTLATLASMCLYNAAICVGASGAIFGLYGFFLACLALKVFPPKFRIAFIISTIVFVGYYLLMTFTGSKDIAAHICGLLSGFILGSIMSEQLKQKKEEAIEQEIENEL